MAVACPGSCCEGDCELEDVEEDVEHFSRVSGRICQLSGSLTTTATPAAPTLSICSFTSSMVLNRSTTMPRKFFLTYSPLRKR